MDRLREHINIELSAAESLLAAGDPAASFRHLERAHVLGQAITYDHTRVRWRMLKLGWRMRNWQEIWGRLLRVVGASTETPLGIYPAGNTGGSDVWFFKSMPVPAALQLILDKEKM